MSAADYASQVEVNTHFVEGVSDSLRRSAVHDLADLPEQPFIVIRLGRELRYLSVSNQKSAIHAQYVG